MSLPFDLEDVFGVAVAELIKKIVVLGAALVWGSFQVLFVLLLIDVVESILLGGFVLDDLRDELSYFFTGGFFAWLAPVFSLWALPYLVSLLGWVLYAFKSDGSLWRIFLSGLIIVGVFILLFFKIYEHWTGILAFLMWAMAVGGLIVLSVIWGNRARQKAEIHLMGVAVENERIRAEREEAERWKYSG